MNIIDITPCFRITKENEFCGMETYVEIGSKVLITYENRNTLIGYIQILDYGKSPYEDDMLVLQLDNGTLVGVMMNLIADIEAI